MPSVPSSGLLMYRLSEKDGWEGNPAGGHEGPVADACLPIEVLLFPRSAVGRPAARAGVFEIPVWELERPVDDGGRASRAGRPFEPRSRNEMPRLTAARTMEALLEHACASFAALTGTLPAGPFLPLGGVKMRRHRIVYVWACRSDGAPGAGRFLALDDARAVIEGQQRRFLEQLDGLIVGGEVR